MLTRLVITGRRHSLHSFTNDVGSGSSEQVEEFDFDINFETSSSVAGLKDDSSGSIFSLTGPE
jgi:hypothetical protein